MRPITRHGTGQAGEYLVAAELARHGFTVALPTGNAESVDILARGHGRSIAVQVKTAGRGDHQFNLGKFVEIEFLDDGGQVVHGPRKDLERDLYFVLVILGDRAGNDVMLWTTVCEFSEFLATIHQKYLDRHGGRRPGRNPKSLHASVSLKDMQAARLGRNLVEALDLIVPEPVG